MSWPDAVVLCATCLMTAVILTTLIWKDKR